jgi:SAM-dependent methyltransferase
MSLWSKFLGTPWVYDRLRPLVVGGFDLSRVFAWMEPSPDDVILDVGCGTGFALDHISNFKEYHGFDPDERAIATAQAAHPQPNIHLSARIMTASDVQTLRPTKALLLGLLHHLTDNEVGELLRTLQLSGTVKRIITWDPVYRRGKFLNNMLGRLDRGKYVRYEPDYDQLVKSAGLEIVQQLSFSSGNGMALYYSTCSTPKAL